MITDYLQLDLIKELGLENLPDTEKKQLEDKMTEVVGDRINTALLSRLSEEDKQSLDVLLDTDGDVTSFFKEKIPGIDLIIAEVVSDFKKEMISLYALSDELKKEQHGGTTTA